MKALLRLFVWFCLASIAQNCVAGTLVAFHFFLGSPVSSNYFGDVDVELYDKDKPITAGNFLRLVEAGAYAESFFHRCQAGFVLQGGGYGAFDPTNTNIMAPPYTNLFAVPNFGSIPDEINSGPFHSNVYGTVAMAKSGPNTANSQFFFNINNNSASLDSTNNSGGFTVFGHVIQGTNLLNEFNGIVKGHNLVDLTDTYGTSGLTSAFTQLPIALNNSTNPPPYNGLIYFTVSTLSANAQLLTNGTVQISWLSVANLTNNVEYSTNLPPVWHVFAGAVGNGTSIYSVNDLTTNQSRFYRIHILY